MRTNIDRMRELDEAWNERRWTDLGDLLSEKVVAHLDGRPLICSRDAYLEADMALCRLYPDAHRVVEPYVSIFGSADGRRTASIIKMTGIDPTHLLEVRLSVITTWTNGVVSEQSRFWEMIPDRLRERL